MALTTLVIVVAVTVVVISVLAGLVWLTPVAAAAGLAAVVVSLREPTAAGRNPQNRRG